MLFNPRRTTLFIALMIAVVFVFSATAPGAPARPGKVNIVKIIDTAGALRFEVIESDLVNYLKKEINTEYKQAKADWNKARADWEDKTHSKKFPCPKPVKPEFKVVAKGLQDESAAQEELEVIQEKEPYSVVQVIEGEEKKTPEIVHNDEVKKMKYDLEMAYFEKVKQWNEEKLAFAEKQPEAEFDKPMPVEPDLKVLKKGLKTLEKAEAALEKYIK